MFKNSDIDTKSKHGNVHMMLTTLVVGIFCLGGGIFSVAYAQTETTDPISNITGLVVAIGSLMGAMAAIATSVVGSIKSATGNSLISKEMEAKIKDISANMESTDEWIKEHTKDIGHIVEAVTKVSPQTKEILDENGLSIKAITEDIKNTEEELRKVYEKLPKTNLPK